MLEKSAGIRHHGPILKTESNPIHLHCFIMKYTTHNDDCLIVLKSYPDNHFDSIVTDPPAGISFMGKDWDHDKGGRESWIEWMTKIAEECLRTLKPGGHALVWALPRTSHWTATAWEDAGFEVRDIITHVFGSGFPKSYNIAKGIEGILTNGSASWNNFHKLNGKKGKKSNRGANGLVSTNMDQGNRPESYVSHGTLELEATTPEAKNWEGWGTALKPASENWILLRKPISERTVAANVLKWGTGGLNIDATRIEINGEIVPINKLELWSGFGQKERPDYDQEINRKGRWPANFMHDGSDEVLAYFPEAGGQQGDLKDSDEPRPPSGIFGDMAGENKFTARIEKDKSAARFFYCSKPKKAEKNEGVRTDAEIDIGHNRFDKCAKCGGYILQNKERPSACVCDDPVRLNNKIKGNHHPTVKSLELMRYLIKLVTPPFGIILDPFMGSGTTGVAGILDGFEFVGIENDKDNGYYKIAEQRLKHASRQERLF